VKRLARWALTVLALAAIAAGQPMAAVVLGGAAGMTWTAHLTK
jgi:hypothetical protein